MTSSKICNHDSNLELEDVAFYGRTMLEYFLFFNAESGFSQINHCKFFQKFDRILDCPSGASSFVSEANKKGVNVVGCDPLFDSPAEFLMKRGIEDIEKIIKKVNLSHNLYRWDFYKSPDDLKRWRKKALNRFIRDYQKHLFDKRYIKGELPKLPFPDKSFELVLSGHFLFTYAEKFDLEFHLSAIMELMRVSSKEVRIYPLQQGMIPTPYQHFSNLLTFLKQNKIDYEIVPVIFEFQKGSNKMLRLLCN